jgi:hypothetical protein
MAALLPVLRALGDPRLHCAINCASMGWPSLHPVAFSADGLEEQLQAAARAFINAPHGVAFEGNRLALSSIFEWYRKDFGGTDRTLLEHLASHAETPLRERLLGASGIGAYRYDWRLNAAET